MLEFSTTTTLRTQNFVCADHWQNPACAAMLLALARSRPSPLAACLNFALEATSDMLATGASSCYMYTSAAPPAAAHAPSPLRAWHLARCALRALTRRLVSGPAALRGGSAGSPLRVAWTGLGFVRLRAGKLGRAAGVISSEQLRHARELGPARPARRDSPYLPPWFRGSV